MATAITIPISVSVSYSIISMRDRIIYDINHISRKHIYINKL